MAETALTDYGRIGLKTVEPDEILSFSISQERQILHREGFQTGIAEGQEGGRSAGMKVLTFRLVTKHVSR